MARKGSRTRYSQQRPARHIPPPQRSLGHTAGRSIAPYEPFNPTEFRGVVRPSLPTVRSPLIRTVLADFQPAPAPRGRLASALLQSRATGRSDDRKIRSPFLTAQGITPELTQRALECAGRTIRREVLFATKRTGKGSKSPRSKPSKVRC